MYKDPFNFFPDEDFEKKPTHRISLHYRYGQCVSSPAIFNTDEEAIDAAKKEAAKDADTRGIVVSRYADKPDENGLIKLKTIYTEVLRKKQK